MSVSCQQPSCAMHCPSPSVTVRLHMALSIYASELSRATIRQTSSSFQAALRAESSVIGNQVLWMLTWQAGAVQSGGPGLSHGPKALAMGAGSALSITSNVAMPLPQALTLS